MKHFDTKTKLYYPYPSEHFSGFRISYNPFHESHKKHRLFNFSVLLFGREILFVYYFKGLLRPHFTKGVNSPSHFWGA